MNIQKEESFNRALGLRLMALRQRRQISQHDLGAFIGVSGQQIQKYENGINRITPEKLARCAHVLKIPVGYFYGEDEVINRPIQTHIYGIMHDIAKLHPDIQKTLVHHIRMINRTAKAANTNIN